jgi:type II secretory pathway pseudopilin PulG
MMEIMIVVLLVAILTAISLPALSKARQESRIKEATVHVEILAAAVRQLAWDTGLWPGARDRSQFQGNEIWDLMSVDAGLLSNDGDFTDWAGPYVHDVPETDPWGSPYFFDADYRVDGVWRVVVGSFGPNRTGRNVYDSDNIYVLVDD